MNNASSVIRIAALFFCLITLFSYGVYSLFLKPEKINPGVNYVNVFNTAVEDDIQSSVQTVQNNTSQIDNDHIAAAVSSANGEVLGKVKNKTIKNSSANLSAGGVHIKNSTDLTVDIGELLTAKLGYTIEKGTSAQVLILHTHATESFLSEDRDYYTSADNSRTTDNSSNVVALGSIITDKLNNAGIATVHDTTQHDYPSYNESYSRASKTIKSYIKKYPSIKVVIDIHRDAIQSGSEKTKLTSEIDGKRAAQVMIVMGSQSGNVKNFPNWKENLKLALRLQKNLESMYPTLSRPLSLMPRSYNEPLTTGSMLIEIGTDANAFSEAIYSAELLANSLIKTLGDG